MDSRKNKTKNNCVLQQQQQQRQKNRAHPYCIRNIFACRVSVWKGMILVYGRMFLYGLSLSLS